MKKFKPYPKYKDSGVFWIGKVPENWKLVKTKYVFSERVEKGYPNEPLLAATQTKGVVPKSMYENRTVEAQKDLHLLKLVNPGDFVISLRSFQGGIEYSKHRGIISPAYTVMIPNNRVSDGYFRHLAKSKEYIFLLQTCVTGIREGQNINYELLRKTPMPIPPESEQTQIARYLDWQTSKINKFIKNKKKLIALLKEQKQNIINEAVTKGINPNVKMKNSGVEWIGEIPEHWEVRKLKYCIHGKLKYGANASGVEYSTKYPRYIRITDFNSHGHLDQTNKLSLNIERYEEYLLDEGDLLFARSGATVGKVFQCKKLDETSCFAGYLIKAKPNKSIATSDFLYLYTQSFAFDRWKTSIFNKATIENIGADKYSQLIVVIPPIKEQDHIFKKLQKEAAIIDKTIARTEKEIELIQEYRTSLVSDVVTGKIDVRDVEIPDFEEKEIIIDIDEVENGDEEVQED